MMLLKIVTAYEAAKRLKDTELDFSSAHTLMMLIKDLEPHALFYAEGERRLVKKYAKKDKGGNILISEGGRIEFADVESAEAFERERRDLSVFEVEIDTKPRKVKAPERISAAVLMALYGFIEFEQGGI
ncbi:MAG: hypothetical protein IJ303_02705 [Clostridia bacterium]|nr:hypothetical protein [Clostridia bacterium]